MSETEQFLIAYALWWLCGVFFGMGVEEKLLAPRRRKVHRSDRNSCCPKPLPLGDIKLDHGADDPSQQRTLVVPKNKNKITVGIVVGRNVPALIPRRDCLSEARGDSHPTTPNAAIKGEQLVASPARETRDF